MRVLAISGSLRSLSTNTSLIRALRLLTRPGLEVSVYEELDQIPPWVLKNALDRIVGSGELPERPVVLVNASSRGVFAQAAEANV